ncbi:hypothetical protein SAMN02744040_01180 [Tepidibacter thalassicus DSM 15285]|uniref:MerR HTH family regulatory protein n=1 Tax=Tepidibacter thalassicus DSM 15285 TaxID=1123350 RepID=A0A1M5R1E4_9FIRM|nr:hypothetical protein SAMN02744040_01180 [Tepidibacter thalassicus DSM 15285]
MKAKEVLELLQISRPTLTKYVKEGIIKTTTLSNGRYDYDKDSVIGYSIRMYNKRKGKRIKAILEERES